MTVPATVTNSSGAPVRRIVPALVLALCVGLPLMVLGAWLIYRAPALAKTGVHHTTGCAGVPA